MRTKYRFKSRAVAEVEVVEFERIALLRYRGMRALERGEVHWTKRHGNYQLGLFDLDSPSGPRCLVRFWGNGEVETDAYDFEVWASGYDELPLSGQDPEVAAFREIVAKGRKIVYDANKVA